MVNIESWPLHRVDELPDFVFGSRWVVCLGATVAAGGTVYVLCSEGLPELCVVWGVVCVSSFNWGFASRVTLALGDTLPTGAADFAGCQRLIKGVGVSAAGPNSVVLVGGAVIVLGMRLLFEARGRRFVVEFVNASTAAGNAQVFLTVGGVPKEVPDWLVSDRARSL